MANVKVLIAEPDERYIMALERKFIDGYEEQIDLIAITDKDYFNQIFLSPQCIDIMIINEEFYNSEFEKHDIDNIFILTEKPDNLESTSNLNMSQIYKYTSTKEIYNEIVNNLNSGTAVNQNIRKGTKLITIYSPIGGIGKTTVAMGLCASLSKNYKKVIYIGTDSLQAFGIFMKEPATLQNEVEKPIQNKSEYICSIIESVIKDELFSILPPFMQTLPALNITLHEYIFLIEKLKEIGKYDYIVVDCESLFSNDISHLMSVSESVIILTGQDKISKYKTEKLFNNIDCSNSDKFTFIGNKYKNDESDITKYKISSYLHYYEEIADMDYEQLGTLTEIQKIAYAYI